MARATPPRHGDGDFEILALDLSGVAVRLLARTEFGSWVELGRAPLDDDDFSGRITELREEAERRAGAPGPVALWLPAEQVTLREYRIGRLARPRAEALRRLAAEGLGESLSVALTRGVPGGPVTVLAVPASTVRDARAYAARWGFVPGRVSTRVEAARFGLYGPVFELPARRQPRSLPIPRAAFASTAAAAALALAIGLGLWGGWQPPGGGQDAMAGEPGVVAEERLRKVVQASVLPFERRRPIPAGSERVLAAPLAVPATGAAADIPVVPVPEADPTGAALPPGHDAAPPRDAAADGPDAAAARTPGAAPIFETVGRLRDTVVPVAMAARPAETPAPEITFGIPAGEGGRAAASEPGGELLLAAARVAPDGTPVPPRRPDEAADRAAPVKPDAGSALAARQAPRPPEKPGGGKSLGHITAHRVIADAAPASVQAAASQRGLSLAATSLIGVLEGRSGRQALIRTASGGFLRVGRGDSVEGWRVSAIGRDAITLTRNGQDRKLELAVR